MKQGKRKSNRRPVSKERIRQASYAKQQGLLSKRAKLSGGKLSRPVNKKIEALLAARAVPTYEFRPGAKRAVISEPAIRKAMKVKPAQEKRAREAGLMVVNHRLIVPKKGDYQRANREGLTAGYRPPSEESYGVDTILLSPLGIRNFADLRKALLSGSMDRYVGKANDDRLFAFTIFGYHPRGGITFLDGQSLQEYLNKYQWDDNEEAFQNFELMTVPYDSDLGPTPMEVIRHNRMRFASRQDRREGLKRKHYKVTQRRRALTEEEVISRKHARDKAWRAAQKKRLGAAEFNRREAARKRSTYKPR